MRTRVMKIDVKRLHGRELKADRAERPRSFGAAYGYGEALPKYSWLIWAVPITIGCLLAKLSWTAFLMLLGASAGLFLLMAAAVIYALRDADLL